MQDYNRRPYQSDALNAAIQYLREPSYGGLAVLPTGTGKSFIIADLIHQLHQHNPHYRILMITHVKELIEQNFEKLKVVWQEPRGRPPAGINSAGLERRQTTQPIIYGGIQSVYKIGKKFGHVDLLVIDECHRLSDKSDGMYQRFIAALRTTNPNILIVGFTATPYRSDLGRLENGKIFDKTFYDISRGRDFEELIEKGFLSDLIGVQPHQKLDLSRVKIVRGEFSEQSLDEYVNRAEITLKIVEETLVLRADRRKGLAFCVSKSHAEDMAARFSERGLDASHVHSGLSVEERDERIRKFRSGEISLLTNVGVLTTGFDVPDIDYIVMARPTRSPSLHVQMLGRGMRPAPTKQNCLVLDYGGNFARLGMVNDIELAEPTGEKDQESVRAKPCKKCNRLNPPAANSCRYCGQPFATKKKQIKPDPYVYVGEVIKRKKKAKDAVNKLEEKGIEVSRIGRTDQVVAFEVSCPSAVESKTRYWLLLRLEPEISNCQVEGICAQIEKSQGRSIKALSSEIRKASGVDQLKVFRRADHLWDKLDSFSWNIEDVLAVISMSTKGNLFREAKKECQLKPPFQSEFERAKARHRKGRKEEVQKAAREFLHRGLDGRRPTCILGKGSSCFFIESKYSKAINCRTCGRLTSFDEIRLAIEEQTKSEPSPSYSSIVRSNLS